VTAPQLKVTPLLHFAPCGSLCARPTALSTVPHGAPYVDRAGTSGPAIYDFLFLLVALQRCPPCLRFPFFSKNVLFSKASLAKRPLGPPRHLGSSFPLAVPPPPRPIVAFPSLALPLVMRLPSASHWSLILPLIMPARLSNIGRAFSLVQGSIDRMLSFFSENAGLLVIRPPVSRLVTVPRSPGSLRDADIWLLIQEHQGKLSFFPASPGGPWAAGFFGLGPGFVISFFP